MRWFDKFVFAVAAVAIVASAHPAAAQSKLDTPGIRQVDNSSMSVTFEVAAGPSGAPAGFVVDWMKQSDYNALGGWPAAGNPALHTAFFNGTPTWNVSTGSYQLASGAKIEVEIGDLYEETGVVTDAAGLEELNASETIVYRVHAAPVEGASGASDVSETGQAGSKGPTQNCTGTVGYWKNHEDAWPVDNLNLGNRNYTKAELVAILDTQPNGNGLIQLAHQLIAAKLGVANGADPSPIAATIVSADNKIGNLVVPPTNGSTDFLPPDDPDANKLADYNSGKLGPPHCGSVPTRPTTWGNLKSMYR